MRPKRFAFLLFACILVPVSGTAQHSPPPAPRDPQAVSLLRTSLAALTGTTTIRDVTVSGRVTRIAGSDNETGTATLKATAIGQSRIDLNLPFGQRSEVRDTSVDPPTGSWSGPDGVWHPIALHNLLTDPAWYFPQFLLGRLLSSSDYAISSVDMQIVSGAPVQHLTAYQKNDASVELPSLVAKLSRVDIYLASSNPFPVAFDFAIHPDNDAGLDIPVEIWFSNYQSIGGVQVPYNVQKYVNNSLALEFDLQTTQLNTGLASADFQAR